MRQLHHPRPLGTDWMSKALPSKGAPWTGTSDRELGRIGDLMERFLDVVDFEPIGGMRIDDTVRFTVAAHAARLVTAIGFDAYRDVGAVIVYPTTITTPSHRPDPMLSGAVDECPTRAIGQAMLHGPVVLAWDAVVSQVEAPWRSRNVIYHEFAHKIDMLTGAANGVPPVGDREAMRAWQTTMAETIRAIAGGFTADSVLGGYAEVSPAELFAIATEVLFTRPDQLRLHHPELASMMERFYRPDTA